MNKKIIKYLSLISACLIFALALILPIQNNKKEIEKSDAFTYSETGYSELNGCWYMNENYTFSSNHYTNTSFENGIRSYYNYFNFSVVSPTLSTASFLMYPLYSGSYSIVDNYIGIYCISTTKTGLYFIKSDNTHIPVYYSDTGWVNGRPYILLEKTKAFSSYTQNFLNASGVHTHYYIPNKIILNTTINLDCEYCTIVSWCNTNGLFFDKIIVQNSSLYYSIVDSSNTRVEMPIYDYSTSLYLNNDTYNYMILTFDTSYPFSAESYQFFNKYYRILKEDDILNLNLYNNKLNAIDKNQFNFFNLVGAIIDAPFNTLRSVLSFKIFGLDLFAFLSVFITISLIAFVVRFLKGGKNDE